jgi:hypothetical protein
MAPVAEVLLLLGLVGLYTRQSEAAGVPGLISLVCGGLPLGTVLSQDFVWANLLLGLGFVRGILSARQDLPAHRRRTSHRRRGDHRVVDTLVSGEPGSILVYVGADVVNVARAWLGFSLFLRREEAVDDPGW